MNNDEVLKLAEECGLVYAPHFQLKEFATKLRAQAMKELSEIEPVGYVSKDTICNIKKRFNPKFNALQMISLRVKKYGKMTEPLIPRPKGTDHE